MKLEGEFVFDAGVQEVWDALFDPAVLAAAMPGCEKLERVDGSYVGELKVKVGPIQGKFTGKVDMLDTIEPKSYRMVVDGRGAQGFVKADATIVLEPDGTRTRLRYDADAKVGGKIASVGQRLVETSARAIVKESLDGLSDNIKIRAEAHRAQPAAVAEPSPAGAPPAIEYKRADAGKLAGTVAKEVGKTMAPAIVIGAIAIGVVIYLLVR